MRQLIFACIALLGLLFAACGGANSSSDQGDASSSKEQKAPPKEEVAISEEVLAAGEAVYNTYCMACHMADGNGVPNMNPPLGETEWVNGDKATLINIVLKGLTEPIEVHGETYSSIMPPHNFLSDEDIASVLTFVKNSFGNSSGSVTTEEVASLRAGG
ncbi:MAG: cytochrome c [Bacteroidota bacterium]